jgi:hypothetical protein
MVDLNALTRLIDQNIEGIGTTRRLEAEDNNGSSDTQVIINQS